MEIINYAFIGDVHSQADALGSALEYCLENRMTPILLGDLFDSRVENSQSAEVYRMALEAVSKGATILRSNHQNKLERYIRGNKVMVYPDLQKTLDDFSEANIDLQEVLNWLDTFPYGVALRDSRGVEYRCAHAYFPDRLLIPSNYEGIYKVDTVSRGTKNLMLFGPQVPGAQWPQEEARVSWWGDCNHEREDWVRVAGHYHHVYIGDRSLVLDGEMGGGTFETREDPCLCLWDVENQSLHEFRQ
jgi:hypothetical protein